MQSWFALAGDNQRAVSIDKAMHLGPVFSAVRHGVDFVSTLPVDSFRDNPDGSRTPSRNLPPILRSQNDVGRYGVGQWLGQCVYGIFTRGNAVGWIVEHDGFGYPSVVRWVRGEDWSFDEHSKQWYVAGQPVPSSRIFHVPWIVPTGCTLGLSPLELHYPMISAGLSAQDYADVKRGGGIPPTVLRNTQKVLDKGIAERVRDRAAASFARGEPFVTGNDWDLNVPAIPPNHAQFIETHKLSANAIAAAYGIDPREIGGTASDGSITYTTDESRSLNRANNMRPYIERIEAAINLVLPERQFVKLNVDATIRADISTRVEIVGAQIADGRMSVNEARALEDRPPVPGGDFHNVPSIQPPQNPVQRQGEPS